MKKLFWLAIVLILWAALGLLVHRSAARAPDLSRAADPASGGWTQLGTPTAPGGTVIDLASAPSDPQALYALLEYQAGGRLYRSPDAAESWTQVYTFTQSVGDLAVDPVISSTIYAGSDEGLLRSYDSGLSWTQIYTVGQVVEVISPTLVYAAGQVAPSPGCSWGEVHATRSVDGGATWVDVSLGCLGRASGLDLAVIPGDPDMLWLALNVDAKIPQVWRSIDSGTNWQSTFPFCCGPVYSLAVDPQTPQHVYLSLDSGLAISQDGGLTWQFDYGSPVPRGLFQLAFQGGSLYAVSTDTDVGSIYRSEDGGQSWWQSLYQLPAGANVLEPAPGQPDTLYVGLWGYGIWRSQNRGGIWQEMDRGLHSPVWVKALAADPDDELRLYAGSDWPRPGLFESEDGGLSWTETLTDSATTALAIHSFNPGYVFAGGPTNGLRYRTPDGQWQWAYGGPVGDIAFSSASPPLIIVGGFFNSPYQGDPPFGYVTHSPFGPHFGWYFSYPPEARVIQAVAADPHRPDVFFAAGFAPGKGAGIWRSQDEGETWQIVFYSYIPHFNDLLADPFHDGWIYAAGYAGIYRSTDGGDTWAWFSDGVPSRVHALAEDELGNLYAAGEQGVFILPSGASTWQPFGLDEYIYTLTARLGPHPALLAGGWQGVWRYDLAPVQKTWLPVVFR